MASLPSSHGGSSTKATSKPWCITFHEDVLIWKQSTRLKLQGGMTAGRVISASVLDDKEKTVQLKGNIKDDPRHYTFCAHLSSFEKDSNDFAKQLAPFMDNPEQFCSRISEITGGTVVYDSKCEDDVTGPSKQLTKRSSEDPPTVQSKKAKQAEIEEKRMNEAQKEIVNNEIGVFSIPVTALHDPPALLRVREVKDWYVDYLAGMLLEDKSDHEDLTAPLLVIASVEKDKFQEKNISKYTYEVIGGIQRFFAIRKVNEMGHDRNITSRKCAVYGSELSRAGKLILARQHNEFNQIQRTTTFPEMSACCRRLMFAHFAPDQYDDGTYVPDVPRYNAQPYRDWKSECTTFLQSSSASQSMVEQAIQMALQPPGIYHKMQTVFKMYEEGTLKDQKKRVMNGTTLQMAIEGKLAPKLPQFKVFQGLKDEEKEKLLDELIAGKISFGEAESESKKYKSLNAVKDAFLKEVQLKSWEEAEEVIQKIGSKEVLSSFNVKQGKPLPKNFEAFCHKARCVVSKSTSRKLTPFHKEDDTQSAFFVADVEDLFDVDFSEYQTIFVNLIDVTVMEQAESIIQATCQSAKEPWTLVLYNPLASIDTNKLEKACHYFNARHCRILTVCGTIKSDDFVELASAKEVVLAWWGKGHPPVGHIMSEGPHVNSIVCHPQDEETMVAQESTGWINYLCKLKPKKVMDLYSETGEVSQVCSSMGLVYSVIEKSEDKLRTVMSHLGMNPASESESSEESTPMDTNELLEELSDVQRQLEGNTSKATTSRKNQASKKSGKEKSKKKGIRKATPKKKAAEGKRIHTRSKGAIG